MHATAEVRQITTASGKVVLPSLTQKLGPFRTVELDGCACDLLVALHVNDRSLNDRKLCLRADRQRCERHRKVSLTKGCVCATIITAKRSLALPWTGTADLMLAPRKVLGICAAAMVNQVFFSTTGGTLLDFLLSTRLLCCALKRCSQGKIDPNPDWRIRVRGTCPGGMCPGHYCPHQDPRSCREHAEATSGLPKPHHCVCMTHDRSLTDDPLSNPRW